MSAQDQTYDFICFTDLAYEFTPADQVKIEKKIKARLKYHQLGQYDQSRVNYIRQLKNDLSTEISLTTKSKYYHKSSSGFAALQDFDVERMTTDYHEKYANVDRNELKAMIDFAVYLYYMR